MNAIEISAIGIVVCTAINFVLFILIMYLTLTIQGWKRDLDTNINAINEFQNTPKKIVYLSGAITGTTDYRRRFKKAQRMLEKRGYKVFNPCCIPEIFKYDQYLQIDFAVLDCCDYIYFLPHESTKRSNGSIQERERAKGKGIEELKI